MRKKKKKSWDKVRKHEAHGVRMPDFPSCLKQDTLWQWQIVWRQKKVNSKWLTSDSLQKCTSNTLNMEAYVCFCDTLEQTSLVLAHFILAPSTARQLKENKRSGLGEPIQKMFNRPRSLRSVRDITTLNPNNEKQG